jgi:hypothetical protein
MIAIIHEDYYYSLFMKFTKRAVGEWSKSSEWIMAIIANVIPCFIYTWWIFCFNFFHFLYTYTKNKLDPNLITLIHRSLYTTFSINFITNWKKINRYLSTVRLLKSVNKQYGDALGCKRALIVSRKKS